ncbi:heterotrimeric G protein alpha subunit B [Laccaria bicolor S238N-H82]|uniref:Heterotrimeric G protein alpha subunit B n=1 Tax=Laccaria bicolor (strain S238N-H82 / ATCC MYA-4686) TaxID=486041 RepID=B0DJ46_LACBS|nr:heterotrimeric G protein alpha subunit B [Laccaria bicolor S238N-H82]EDR05340.1 heterotrimeric G protein alpha subunit B [Laccaria bicolor S238N-H82]|eukprot:XP_001883898.1 heterotrimeric G protein alpha subunit B [Laccaria bicolor S238N-H82]
MEATDHDPLAIFMRPPPNETPTERGAREEREAHARQISDQIDEQLKKDKAALKRQNGFVRLLLLGQSESGKSTTIKNFRMKYSHAQWKAERLSWRAVIQLNLVRSVLTILDTIQTEMDGTTSTPTPSVVQETSSHKEDQEEDDPIPCATTSGVGILANISRRSSLSKDSNSSLRTTLSSQHQILKLRLEPLRRVEADLKKHLGAGSDEEEFDSSASLGVDPLGPSSSSLAISCFDERLQEDSKINRLKDSLLLWRCVCSSKLLVKATLILFLNKCDILNRKLKSGVMVKKFLPNYGERPNEAGSVIKYLEKKFKDILKEQSLVPRMCYCYATSVTDTEATANTLKTGWFPILGVNAFSDGSWLRQ